MTRIAPTLTLLAVAALGGGMFVANAINDPASTQVATPTPAAAAAPAAPANPNVIDLSAIAEVGAPPAADATVVPAAGSGQRTEISLADLPVAGAPADAAGAAPAAPAGGSGSPAAFAGRTDDNEMSVAVAVQGDKASGYVCKSGTIEAWLTGTADGGTLSLKSKTGRTVLTGTVGAAGVDGTVSIDGVDSGYRAASTDVATAAKNGRPDVGKVVQRLGSTG